MPTHPTAAPAISLETLAADMWNERGEGAWPPACALKREPYRAFAAMALGEVAKADAGGAWCP